LIYQALIVFIQLKLIFNFFVQFDDQLGQRRVRPDVGLR
jgi:hypothetical protein